MLDKISTHIVSFFKGRIQSWPNKAQDTPNIRRRCKKIQVDPIRKRYIHHSFQNGHHHVESVPLFFNVRFRLLEATKLHRPMGHMHRQCILRKHGPQDVKIRDFWEICEAAVVIFSRFQPGFDGFKSLKTVGDSFQGPSFYLVQVVHSRVLGPNEFA